MDSRFDVQTEKELAEWNDLNRRQMDNELAPKDRIRFKELSTILASPG